jgi:3-oxoacyl-[acyl-carrier-protein] synthase III
MRLADTYLAAVGTYLPEPVSIDDAVRRGLYDADEVAESGFRSVLDAGATPGPDMAVAAARDALGKARVKPAELDLFIHASVFFQGPEMWSTPGYILREIGAGAVPAVEIRQGCNGLLYAIELTVGHFAAHPGAETALLTTGDNFNSPLLQRFHGVGPGLLPGDAGSAFVVTKRPGFAAVRSINSVVVPQLEGMQRGAEPLFPPPATSGRAIDVPARAEHFGQTEMPLADAVELIRASQLAQIEKSLRDAGIELADVARVIYVNGARWLVELNLARPLGLPLSMFTWDFGSTVGHLGASDHAVSLRHLLRSGELRPGDHLLLVGAGPGWSVSAVVLTVLELPDWAGDEEGRR